MTTTSATPCETCKGFGWRYHTAQWGWFGKVSKIICPTCGGTGSAPTPTPPNDDKGGAGPRMGESKEVGNPQGSVVHLASPSSPNDDKGGTTDGE